MSPDSTSCVTRRPQPASRKQVVFTRPLDTEQLGQAKSPPERNSRPLETALALRTRHIETLHPLLHASFNDLTDVCLHDYAKYYYNLVKIRETHLNHRTTVPNSVKSLGVTFQPLDDVKTREDFKALHSNYLVEIEKIRRSLAVKYIYPIDKMNSTCLLERFQTKVCKLLEYAGRCFIAQTEARDYTNHQAVVDLLVIHGHDITKAPLPQDIKAFLVMYKTANNLQSIPSPTVEHTIADALHEINGTRGRLREIVVESTNPQDTNTPPTATASTVSLTTNTSETNNPENSTISTPTTDHHTTNNQDIQPTDAATTPETNTPGASTTSTLTDDHHTTNNQQDIQPTETTHDDLPSPHTNPPAQPDVPNPYTKPPSQLLPEPFLTAAETRNATHPYTDDLDDSFSQCQSQDDALGTLDLNSILDDVAKQKVVRALFDLLTQAIMIPVQEFERATARKEEYARLKLATTPNHLANVASRISKVLQAEPPAERPVLKGLIQECATNTTADLRARVQSLEAKYQQQIDDLRLQLSRSQPTHHTTTIATPTKNPKTPHHQPRGSTPHKPRWEPPRNPDIDDIDMEVYNNKASKNSLGSRNKTWSRTTPTYTTVYPAAATVPSTTRPTRPPYAQQPTTTSTLPNHRQAYHYRRPYHSHSPDQPDSDTNKKRGRYTKDY